MLFLLLPKLRRKSLDTINAQNETVLEKSIKILEDMKEKPTRKQWNSVATRENLLSASTLIFASGKMHKELFAREHRKKKKK